MSVVAVFTRASDDTQHTNRRHHDLNWIEGFHFAMASHQLDSPPMRTTISLYRSTLDNYHLPMRTDKRAALKDIHTTMIHLRLIRRLRRTAGTSSGLLPPLLPPAREPSLPATDRRLANLHDFASSSSATATSQSARDTTPPLPKLNDRAALRFSPGGGTYLLSIIGHLSTHVFFS